LKSKKPTKKDIEIVISNLINHLKVIEERVSALDNIFGLYIKYKKENEGFQEYINEQLKEVKGEKKDN
tara:strand:- start:166 stop:369 length:204 start_codon:yes stop_codon:yes gene_type:complete